MLDRIRSTLGIEDPTLPLLFVAEFTPRKRHQDTILELPNWKDRRFIWLLLAIDLGVAACVHFLGKGDDIPLRRSIDP